MLVVLDTNVVSELMRPVPDRTVVERLDAFPPASLCTSSITVAEVMYGIERLPAGRRRSSCLSAASSIFDEFRERVLPFDDAAARHYGRIVTERRDDGRPISTADAQIASICRDRGVALCTRNIPDFEGLGLDLVDPWRGA